MRRLSLALGLAVLAAAPASAATRSFAITYFDRVRLSGPFMVVLSTGPGSSAHADGPARMLDRLRVEVQGQTLILQLEAADVGGGERGQDDAGAGPVAVMLTTPELVAATVLGPGTLAVDKARAARIDLTLSGSGRIEIGAVTADKVNLLIAGSGGVTLAGKAAQLRLVSQGAGTVDLGKLDVADAEVAANGTGDVTVSASRAAKGTAQGSGNVTILGTGACGIAANGVGLVTCHPAPAK